MANMQKEKTKMPEQNAKIRASQLSKKWLLGYTEEMAINEAQRCLQCKHQPCVAGCPVMVQDTAVRIELIAQAKAH